MERGIPNHVNPHARLEQLSHDAQFLLKGKGMRPMPTLAAQREKIQEIEKLATNRGGTAAALPGDVAHKRATEQAREAVITRGVVEVQAPDHHRPLNPQRDLDQELNRKHAERLTHWMERTKHATVARGQQLYWKQMVDDFKKNSTGVIESLGAKRGPIGDNRHQAISENGGASQMMHGGAAPTQVSMWQGVEQVSRTLPLDWRTEQYCSTIQCLPGLDERQAINQQVEHFKQLCRMGPKGERTTSRRQSAEGLWESVGRILTENASVCDSEVDKRMVRVNASRCILEEDFMVFLGKGRSQYTEIIHLAEAYATEQLGTSGLHSEQLSWAVVYLCLRAGNLSAATSALNSVGDQHAAAVLNECWPLVSSSRNGVTIQVPVSESARSLRVFTDAELQQNPYKCAVRLILSRCATNSDVERVKTALYNTVTLRFSQDHVWFHLALVNCPTPPPAVAIPADTPYSLEYYQQLISNVAPSELSVPLDPLLYCKIMLWSQCYAKLIAAILPPSQLDDLSDFGLEGLHIALILSRHGLLENCAAQLQLYKQLESYVKRLVPHSPVASLRYIRLLPEAAMQEALNGLCLDKSACDKLLGRVLQDGTAEIRNSVVSQLWHVAQCADLSASAARHARERGSVLLSSELYLLSIHYSMTPESRALSSSLGSSSVKYLLDFLNPRMTHAIDSMETAEPPTLTDSTNDVLSAARIVFSHLQIIKSASGSSEQKSIRTFEQLYWIAVLCWNVRHQEYQMGWQVCTFYFPCSVSVYQEPKKQQ